MYDIKRSWRMYSSGIDKSVSFMEVENAQKINCNSFQSKKVEYWPKTYVENNVHFTHLREA